MLRNGLNRAYCSVSARLKCQLRIMDRLIQMGKDLGYEGEKLQNFVKQQQDYERGDRTAES